MERQIYRRAKTMLKKNKVEDLHYLISRLNIKLQQSRQCDDEINTQFNGTE